jgi:4'-phosphopantetheinyl transferase
LKLARHEIHVWLAFDRQIEDPGVLHAFETLLTAEELATRARLRAPHLPRQYLVTRALLRSLLSAYAPGTPPLQWRFEAGDNGKPALAPPFADTGLSFNVAHTAGLVSIAIARERALGVDVEYFAPRGPPLHVAPHYFTAAEAAALEALPQEQRAARFYALWTLKESWLKATGEGLAGGLDRVSFRFDEPRFAAGVSVSDDHAAHWRFWQSAPSPEHLLALALRSELEAVEVSLFRLEPGVELRGARLAAPRPLPAGSDQEQRSQT